MRADHERFLDTRFYGIGRAARIAAMRTADELRSREIAAVALFKPDLGGWIVDLPRWHQTARLADTPRHSSSHGR